MLKPVSLLLPAALACASLLSLGWLDAASADDKAPQIDQKVGAALARFQDQVKGSKELLASAKGVLVMPEVKKTGLVMAGQWGEGALRINDRSVAYYKIEAGSFGFQGGYQETDMVFLFFTEEALEDFRDADQWSAGAESGITVVDKGFGGSVDTLKAKGPVAAFAFGKKGLMGGWSLKGTRFKRITPDH